MKAIVCVGPPASGKTTFAEEYKRNNPRTGIVCRDDVRRQLFDFGHWGEYKFSKEKEKQVTEECKRQVNLYAMIGHDVIIADTNLVPERNKELKRFLEEMAYDVEFKLFDVEYGELLKRDQKRQYPVGQQIIYDMWLRFHKNFDTSIRKYIPDTTKPKAVIFDLDGTLASMDGIRKPFEWDKVYMDEERKEVTNVLRMHYGYGDEIIILSGRDSVCREDTEMWLSDNNIPYSALYMRKEKDSRKDYIVKQELFFDNELDKKYNIVSVYDDRAQMIRTWIAMGMENVFCVGDPFKEF